MQKKILIAILLSSLALLPMQVSAALIPSISIDNGALYTMVMPVTLYLSYSANGGSVMQDCRYSNDGVFDTEPWVSYTSTAAWALDPGTGQKTVHYQVRDTLGSTYQASDTIYLIADNPCSYAANGMYCCARSGPCVGTEADIFHMSSRMNAHAELPSQTNYPYRVCCGGITGLGGSCTGPGPSESAINLSATYNAHAEKNTMANYANGACLSAPAGIIDCSYTTGACSSLGPNYACLGTISADMNAHVSDCDGIGDYSEKICCSYAEPPCELKSATILGVCGGGALPACEVGESVSMTATTTGNCSSVTSFEIDAAGGACTVLLTNSTPAVSAGSVSGLWTIASIPTACSAVTVTASAARLYNISGLVASNVTPYVTGSFTFKDVVEPETTLNPYVPDPTNITTPTYTGSATDASSNIASVQYRIDGGAWLNAIASDGNFNSPSEAFTFTAPALADGTHLFEAMAVDASGNSDSTPASDTLTIDTSVPVISAEVQHYPASPTDLDNVWFNASANDPGTGLDRIIIYVDDRSLNFAPVQTCIGYSPCTSGAAPYPAGTYSYYAIARDISGNEARSPAVGYKTFTVTGCTIQEGRITLNDANGNTAADQGERVSMWLRTTGDCLRADALQIDANDGGLCRVEFNTGIISGIYNYTNLIVTPGYINGTWTVPFLDPARPECSSKTVNAIIGAIYDGGPPGTGADFQFVVPPELTGSFKFRDYVAPTTAINPDGNDPFWTGQEIPFTLTCTDEAGGSGCHSILFKVIDEAPSCGATGYTSRPGSSPVSSSVPCNPGTVCRKVVCFYANDSAGNYGTPMMSRVFQIDRQAPTAALTSPNGEWTNRLNLITVAWTGNDLSGVGISNYSVDYNESFADGTPISGWRNWFYQQGGGPSGSQNFIGVNNRLYFFRVNATDLAGNTGPYSAVRSISTDTEAPNTSAYSVEPDAVSGILTIRSWAWDNISGIFNHTISCVVKDPVGGTQYSIFVQCGPAASFGGISECDTESYPIYFDEFTEINCNLAAEDRAGNTNYTNIFYTRAADHPLIVFVEHSAFISIGETYHSRIYVRNLRSGPDTINITIGGSYPADLAKFLNSSIITYMPDNRNIAVTLQPYEQRLIYIEITTTDVSDYILSIYASSQNYAITDSDSMTITIGFPASFPGIELWSAAALLSVSGLAYFRHSRKRK